MFTISNEILSVQVAEKGAELQSIFNQNTGLEYLWNGDEKYWGKKSPVLFPIVGGLKNNTYTFNGNDYKLNRHGFARDQHFHLKKKNKDAVSLYLESNEQTKAVYPFDFIFIITYSLFRSQLKISFSVENKGISQMYFSVGAHPAFAVPLNKNLTYQDYFLQFNQTENTDQWPLSAEGLLETASIPFINNEEKLPLTKTLFYKDAIVLKHLASDSISILSDQSTNGVKVSFEGFPFMGIWAAKDADFVCIEPWCGIADSVNATGRLEDKEGIITLEPGQLFEKSYSIETF